MSALYPKPGPTLPELFDLFPDVGDRPEFAPAAPWTMPEPYRGLLVHSHHMTVTVEAFYGEAVDVRILAHRLAGDVYARKILLALHDSGRIVQFGIVRIRLDFCTERVRAALLEGKTPVGRILIEEVVLRRIEPTAFLKIAPGPGPVAWFGRELGQQETFGRLGIIHCDEQPAVEVLEIVAPVPATHPT